MVICSKVKVIPATEVISGWSVEFTGRTKPGSPAYTWRSGHVFGSKKEAEASLIVACLDGDLGGTNRYSTYAAELRYGVVKSQTFDRWEMLRELRSRVREIWVACDPRFLEQEGVRKDAAKAERAREVEQRIINRTTDLEYALALEFSTWKPDKNRYIIKFYKPGGVDYYVWAVGRKNLASCLFKEQAGKFSRLKAERIRRECEILREAEIIKAEEVA